MKQKRIGEEVANSCREFLISFSRHVVVLFCSDRSIYTGYSLFIYKPCQCSEQEL